jgi:hypothetical protein
MRASLAPLLALLLLSGCLSPASAPASGTTGPASTTARGLPAELKAPTVLPDLALGQGAGEPNIAVAPDGTIYVTPIDHLFRSRDGGKSFTDLGTSKTDGHGDGDIAVDATGRLHWLGLFGTAGAIPYQHSDDHGDTWSKAVDLSSPSLSSKDGTGSDREWIDATPDGWLYTAWRDSAHGGTIAFRASKDGGDHWLPLVTVGPDRLTGPVVHGPAPGTAYIPMTDSKGTGPSVPMVGSPTSTFHLELAKTTDHGGNWTVLPILTPAQMATMEPVVDEGTVIFPVAAVDAAGTVYVAWSSAEPTAGQQAPRSLSRFGVFLTSSRDGGKTWADPVQVSDPSHAALLPFLAAGAAGRLAIVWYENTVGNPSDTLPDLWNVKLWESTDADRGAVHHVTAQLNAQPSHIGSVCTVGGACLFEAGDRSLLDYFEVALNAAGQPVVAWASSAGGTAVGLAAQPTTAHFGGVADGTPLQ